MCCEWICHVVSGLACVSCGYFCVRENFGESKLDMITMKIKLNLLSVTALDETMPETLPTDRELQILAVLWARGELTVREVYEDLRGQGEQLAQNTVQAFLRLMNEKQLVTYRQHGRAFVYRAAMPKNQTRRRLVSSLVQRAFDGAVDALVQSAFDAKAPGEEELQRLEELLVRHREKKKK